MTYLTHTHNSALLARYHYTLDAVGNRTRVTETVSGVTRIITNTYDALNRQIVSAYSTGEAFTYRYDAVGNRVAMTNTTPLSGTVVTAYTFDAANRLTNRAVSDGRTYTYTWSQRGQMLTEWTNGIPVRTFAYNGAGQMVRATVFTLTTEFVYNGLGARVALSVTGATTRYTLDYAAGNRILAETTPTSTASYLYGHDCLGEFRDDEPLYYLPDAEGYVRQSANADGDLVSAWLFDPDGMVLEGPNGPVSHLVCGGVYDWSTGLLYKGGRYFDPSLGIWLVLLPLMVVQAWPRRKKERGKHPWVMFLCIILVGTLTGCPPSPTPDPTPTRPPCTDTPTPVPPTPTPEPTPTPTPAKLYNRQAAVSYAQAYKNEPNSPPYYYFPSDSGDCTNFVSQALYAGGIESNPEGGWNQSEVLITNERPYYILTDTSRAWINAVYLDDFLLSIGGTMVLPPTRIDHVNGTSAESRQAAENNQVVFSGVNAQPGDVVFYNQGFQWTHTALIVDWGPQTYFADTATSPHLSKPQVVEHSTGFATLGYQPRSVDNTGKPVEEISIIHIPEVLP